MRILRETRKEKVLRVARKVTVDTISRRYISYLILDYIVTLELDGKTPKGYRCSCAHGSMYGIRKMELCWHIECIQAAITLHRSLIWKQEEHQGGHTHHGKEENTADTDTNADASRGD